MYFLSLVRMLMLVLAPLVHTQAAYHRISTVPLALGTVYTYIMLQLPTGLKLPWCKASLAKWTAQQHLVPVPDKLLDYSEFGWPVIYTAPISTLPHLQTMHQPLYTPLVCLITCRLKSHMMLYLDPSRRLHSLLVSPLMTRPKKTSTNRRVILDLSWHTGYSVNSGIPQDTYPGQPYKLKLSTVDNLVALINGMHGQDVAFTQ